MCGLASDQNLPFLNEHRAVLFQRRCFGKSAFVDGHERRFPIQKSGIFRIPARCLPRQIEAPRSPRSTAVRQNLQGMRSLLRFNFAKSSFFSLLPGLQGTRRRDAEVLSLISGALSSCGWRCHEKHLKEHPLQYGKVEYTICVDKIQSSPHILVPPSLVARKLRARRVYTTSNIELNASGFSRNFCTCASDWDISSPWVNERVL